MNWVRLVLKSCLCALVCLLTEKNDIEAIFFPLADIVQESNTIDVTKSTTSKGKTNPKFVCNVHGIPAVRRRCSHGENKEKRFYVCGMERKHRCNYFKWADNSSNITSALGSTVSPNSSNVEPMLPKQINADVQSVIWEILNRGTPSYHSQLCTFFIHFTESTDECHAANQSINHSFRKRLDALEIADEDSDELLFDFVSYQSTLKQRSICFRKFRAMSEISSNQNIILDCLYFLTCVRSNRLLPSQPSWEIWHIPLLRLISKTADFKLKSHGKLLLKCFCGGNKSKYHQIRDSFTFASEFSQLMTLCEIPFETAWSVIEKGAECGPKWQSHSSSLDQIRYGSMIGVHELMSEDAFEASKMERLKAVLSALVTVTKSRGENNWRHFCSLRKIPKINIHDSMTDSNMPDLSNQPPVSLLFWMMCILPCDLQGHLGYLLDVALHGDTLNKLTNISSSKLKINDCAEDYDTPEKLLLIDRLGLCLSDLYSFVVTYVLRGKSVEIRSHSKKVASTLVMNYILHNSSSLSNFDLFMKHLLTLCLRDIGSFGIAGVDLLNLIKSIISTKLTVESVDFQYIASMVLKCYLGQTAFDSVNPIFTRGLIVSQPKGDKRFFEKIDISPCRFCEFESYSPEMKSFAALKEVVTKKRKSSDSSEIDTSNHRITTQWARGQLSEFNRIRLDTHHSVSSEFSSYVQLRSRYSISDIFLTINDQRGRFVKKISISFSPKPVADFHILSESQYDPFWQPLGTIVLAKGVKSASCNLPYPVVVANLKIEYVEFHDKVSEQKTAGGAMILLCPRCARVVNNAHGGVCGNCGEVAFQCRKCRHINYDRLDAFLCVECGYCSSASFSWELNAGVATCAVAIEDEADLERSIFLLQNKQKKCSDVQNQLMDLKAKIEHAPSLQRKKSRTRGINSNYDESLKLAMANKLPPFLLNISSSAEKAKDDASEPASSTENRNKSLLNLILEQARRQRNFPFSDDSDMFDEVRISDPLSRIVATIKSQSRDSDGVAAIPRRKNSDKQVTNSKEKVEANKDQLSKMIEEAKKLHMQVRALENDCHDLESRIMAWKRLNRGEISPRGCLSTSNVYHPSKCPNCSPTLSFHFLDLLHAIFNANMSASEKVLNADFIHSLFDDHEMVKTNLATLKRSVLVTIATTSSIGSLLILDDLKHRLNGRRDSKSAEILGILLESNIKHQNQYVDLALETLKS